jgi:hypothetical protein
MADFDDNNDEYLVMDLGHDSVVTYAIPPETAKLLAG